MYSRSSLIVTLFLLSPLSYPAPIPQEQDPLRFNATPSNPQNKTCSAADTECVVGNLTDPPSSGPPKDTNDIYIRDSQHERRGGTCAADDTECVVGNSTDKPAEGPPSDTSTTRPTKRDSDDKERRGVCAADDTECVVGNSTDKPAEGPPSDTSTTQPTKRDGQDKERRGTCSAADTECVVGNLTDKPSGGPPQNTSTTRPSKREATTEELEKRQSSLESISSSTGIADHNAATTLPPPVNGTNGTNSTDGQASHICAADDIECVVAKRNAQPVARPTYSTSSSDSEEEVDDITLRIRSLQSELDSIRARRSAEPTAAQPKYDTINAAIEHVKRQAVLNPDPVAAAQAFADVVAQTIRNNTSGSAGTSSSSVQVPLPAATNAFGRKICAASDVECVVNGS